MLDNPFSLWYNETTKKKRRIVKTMKQKYLKKSEKGGFEKKEELVFSIKKWIEAMRKSYLHPDYRTASEEEIILDHPWVIALDGMHLDGGSYEYYGNNFITHPKTKRKYMIAQNWLVDKPEFEPYPNIPEPIKNADEKEIRISREAYKALQDMGYMPDDVKPKYPKTGLQKGEWEFEDFFEDYLEKVGRERQERNLMAVNDQRIGRDSSLDSDENNVVPDGRGGVIEDFIDEKMKDFYSDDELPF